MRPDQITRLETLRDRLLEVAMVDADPNNWIGADMKPSEMTRDERGDAKWCRSLATSTVALTMQVQRLMQNPTAAMVPASSEDQTEEQRVEAEIGRYEKAAAGVLAKARAHATK